MPELITREYFLSDMKGKSIIVGLTYTYVDGTIRNRVQFSGTLEDLDQRGIVIIKADGSEFTLPPDKDAYQKAPLGEYKMKTTGEIIVNPEFMTTWTIDLKEN